MSSYLALWVTSGQRQDCPEDPTITELIGFSTHKTLSRVKKRIDGELNGPNRLLCVLRIKGAHGDDGIHNHLGLFAVIDEEDIPAFQKRIAGGKVINLDQDEASIGPT